MDKLEKIWLLKLDLLIISSLGKKDHFKENSSHLQRATNTQLMQDTTIFYKGSMAL
jgi:hypothetical protein